MLSRCRRRSRFPAGVVLVLLAASVLPAPAQPTQDEQDAQKRLEYMQASVAALELSSEELKSKDALALVPKPLLRYNDPTRGGIKEESANNVLLDASVWRLGTEGRPTAIITLEVYQLPNGSRLLAYEFLSLTGAKFSLKHKTEAVRWDATASGLTVKDLPDAPKPAAAATARLAQMRQLARRFGASERFNQESIELRLIAQPIDRYQSDADKITDGAIFALANGTNPEIGILLETDGEHWRYGLLRLGAAEMKVTLDGQAVAAFEVFNARGRRDGPYNSGSHKIPADK